MPEPLGTVGHYDLLRPLGSGGMGDVYLARDRTLDRLVAIKILRGATAADGEARRRLHREAKAAAALDHPNICTVYEVGTDEHGRDFIAMQYVEGDTLARRLTEAGLGVKTTLGLVSRIADALDTAHRRGVVHRDLKPQNIIVSPSGEPKLLDFGIATLRRLSHDEAGVSTITRLDTGALAGTPAYMAPEILRGAEADARSDLFSLGVVLYECLTRTRPFSGRTAQETWGRILHVDPEAPSKVLPGVDPALDTVCQRLLAKDPEGRFQTAAELRGALDVLRQAPGTVPQPTRRPRRWLAAAVVVATIGAAGWWWSTTIRSSLPVPPSDAASWYARGSDAVRQGAFGTGRKALEEAIRIFPDYALAHARLAEALAELDEDRAAQASLIRVSALVPDQSALPEEDGLRLAATQASVLRDHDRAIAAYERLVSLRPTDAGALVDLGRAQEAAGRAKDARASYERATTLDRQFAAGFLRLGVLDGATAVDPALKSLAEAERLYSLASNVEGVVETRLRRSGILDSAGRSAEALRAAEQAGQLAGQSGLLAQEIRAGLRLGSARVGGGAYAEGQAIVARFVDKAIAAELEGIAADGLIDLAGAQHAAGKLDEAERTLVRATALARQRSLTRLVMRATTQHASVMLDQARWRDALSLLEAPLQYYATTRQARLEALALIIASRAHHNLREPDRAREMAERVRTFAVDHGSPELHALALVNLSRQAWTAGHLPETLARLDETVGLLKGLGDVETLPYTLTNRAEVLILLGRGPEAELALQEVDAGITSGLGTFPSRQRRVAMLRTLRAVVEGHYAEARQYTQEVERLGPGLKDETGQLARVLASVAAASTGAGLAVPVVAGSLETTSHGGRQVSYWRAVALLERRDARACARELEWVLSSEDGPGGAELIWRATALSALGARQLGRHEAAEAARATSLAAFERLKRQWGDQPASVYAARPDLVRLLTQLREAPPSPRQ
jgi:tetratricopeptide (TPR) repeat protein/predicted Ser/Thr protein kinase